MNIEKRSQYQKKFFFGHVLVPKCKKSFSNMYLKSSFWILVPKHAKKTTKNFLIFTFFFNIHLFLQYSLIHEWYKVKWISQKWIAKKNCYSLLFNIHLFLLFTYTWFGTKSKLPSKHSKDRKERGRYFFGCLANGHLFGSVDSLPPNKSTR